MASLTPKFNPSNYSDAELKVWLQQSFPILNELFTRFCGSKPVSCSDCHQKKECDKYNQGKHDKTCLVLETCLPGRYDGTGYRENNAGILIEKFNTHETGDRKNTDDLYDNTEKSNQFNPSDLKAIEKVRSEEIFTVYKNCSHIFTKKEWQIVTLRIQSEKTFKEIARILDIAISTASDTFQRARKKMENSYRNKR